MSMNRYDQSPSDSELKLAVLQARQVLKQSLGARRTETGNSDTTPSETTLDWPIETDAYCFKPLPESLLPPPLYGFSVYIKELDIHAYWYRDTLHMNKPLVIFKCNADLTGAVCLG